uniref:CUB domain-containing protein n=1 Tax=Panagrellus redivivus TaxID=6233 RepID=A0A7E4W3A8_PANRE
MGNSVYASASVFKAVNDYYDCAKVCIFKLSCRNGGYQNPANCISCNCPEGFGGPLCERRENSVVATCGGDFKATSVWQTLSATLDRRIGRTPFPFSCYFHIKAPAGKRVMIQLETLRMTCSTACSMNNLMINLGENWYTGSMRLCCTSDIEKYGTFTTAENLAVMGLYSRLNSVYFSVKYKIT